MKNVAKEVKKALNEGEYYWDEYKVPEHRILPKTKEELIEIIKKTTKEKGANCDLNFIDTSLITNMSGLFAKSAPFSFNGDISKWDGSNVTDMSGMFQYCRSFNCDISNWDVSNVRSMIAMFILSDVDVDKFISKWNLKNLIHDVDMLTQY